MINNKGVKVCMPKYLAFAVHLFTASGSVLAFLSLVAACNKNWVYSFAWLGLALFVDGVDGPMARKLMDETKQSGQQAMEGWRTYLPARILLYDLRSDQLLHLMNTRE